MRPGVSDAARLLILIAGAAWPSAGCTCASKAEGEPVRDGGHAGRVARPNVVLVIIDTLRPDHLETYGYGEPTSPFLAALGARSAVFEQAVSTSSWTPPSVASIMTGCYPDTHGVTRGFTAHDAAPQKHARAGSNVIRLDTLAPDRPTLAETFAQNGYRTFGIVTNFNVGPETGLSRGLDRFVAIDTRHPERHTGHLWYGDAREVWRVFDEWRSDLPGETPFFLYLHFTDPHYPYQSRGPMEGTDPETRAYDSEIRFADKVLRRVDDALPDDVITFVLSDHGEAFGEHGYRRHPAKLNAELNRVVFMVGGDGIEASRHDVRVSLVDVMPTLLDLSGLEIPQGIEGRSLVPLLRGGPGADAFEGELRGRPLFAHRNIHHTRSLWSVIDHDWKLILGPDSAELYDLSRDPLERENLAATRRDVRSRLEEALRPRQARMRSGTGARMRDVRVSQEEMRMLRSLGYAQ